MNDEPKPSEFSLSLPFISFSSSTYKDFKESPWILIYWLQSSGKWAFPMGVFYIIDFGS